MNDMPWAHNITREQWINMVAQRDVRIAELEAAIDAAMVALEDSCGPEVHKALVHLKTARALRASA